MVKRIKTAGALLASAIMATILLTTACTDYTPEFDEAAYKYNQSFIDRFGNIDPNQDWNLVRQLAEKNGGGKSTRVNIPNLNQWADGINYHYVVPGYPDVLGTYYTEDGYISKEDFDALDSKPNPVGDVTPEEVQWVSQWFRTHYEPGIDPINWKDYFIQDISADFDREFTGEGKNPDEKKSTPNGNYASCDAGERIMSAPLYYYTGELDGSGKPTFIYSMNPDEITSQLETWGWKPFGTSRTIKYGMEKLLIGIGDDRYGADGWDPNTTFSDDVWTGWEHVYDFNSGTGTNDFGQFDNVADNRGNYLVPNSKLTDRTIQLYKESGTADFSYHNSDVNQRFHKYALKHLVFDIPQTADVCEIHKIKCTNHHYDGYYLGFDYEICLVGADVDMSGSDTGSSVKRKKVGENDGDTSGEESGNQPDKSIKLCYKPRDGFYSNWIVKISHGTDVEGNNPSEYPKIHPLEQGLLVCEDLGATDYDFNDVVLKLQHVKYEPEKGAEQTDRLRITAMAAGGALPSKVYFKDGTNGTYIAVTPEKDENSNEIHKLLYGTDPNIINAAPDFRGEGKIWNYDIDFSKFEGYPGEDYQDKFVSYAFEHRLIKIEVNGDKTKEPIIIGGGAGDIREKGEVPQMMLLPIDYLWPQEGKPIDKAYLDFSGWVTNKDKTEWYTNPTQLYKDWVTMRYVDTSSGTVTVKEPKLSVVRRDNNETIENNGRIDDLNVGDVIRIRCKSPNTTVIECLVAGQKGTTTSTGIIWNIKGLKITWKEGEGLLTIEVTEKAAGEQCQIEFSQEDHSPGLTKTADKIAFTVYINGSGGGGSDDSQGDLKWQDGSQGKKDITIIQGNSQTVYFTGNGNVTPSGYDKDLIDVTVNSGSIYIEAKEDKTGYTTITLTQEGTDDNKLELGVNVIKGGALVDKPDSGWGTRLNNYWEDNKDQTLNMKPTDDEVSIYVFDYTTNDNKQTTHIVNGDTDCVKVVYDDTNNNKRYKITAIKTGTANLVITFPSVSGYQGQQYKEASITITINVSDNVSEE